EGTRRLRPPRPPAPDPAALAELAGCLADAARPVVIAGRTGAQPAAVASLVRLAELLGCPVLDQRDRLNFPPRHPLYAGETPDLLAEADVVLLLDVEVPWVPAHVAPPPDATVLQIDRDCVKPTMPLWTYPIDLAVTADTAFALPLLEDELRRVATADRKRHWETRGEDVTRRLTGVRQQWEAAGHSHDPESATDAMLYALNQALPHDAIVLEEAVTNRAAVTRQIVRDPGFFYAAGSPALGWATAGALGVKLARPDSPVIAVCGDGAFNFGVPTAALWSAQRAGAPFVAVILNNQAYRASKLPVQRLYPGGAADKEGSFPETDLTPPPDYVQLARVYGGDGATVTHPDDIPAALEHCLDQQNHNRCAVLDIRLPGSGEVG
ncbi:MAG: thiamine pyrophosphate-dependent enzyme, partial [Streptosporangiaceae bacterium]